MTANRKQTQLAEPIEKQLWKSADKLRKVFDSCCGSGGMFVQSEKFVAERKGKLKLSGDDIQKIASIYHEWRTAKGKYADIKGFLKILRRR